MQTCKYVNNGDILWIYALSGGYKYFLGIIYKRNIHNFWEIETQCRTKKTRPGNLVNAMPPIQALGGKGV